MTVQRFRRGAPWLVLIGAGLLWAASGCQPVREDRSIQFSGDGEEVSFQHGAEGVFVADAKGGGLQRIFDASDAVAVSSPLWSPTDKRLIFTVAYPADEQDTASPRLPQAWDANPEGRVFFPGEIVYTCMLRGDPAGGEDAEPTPLFQAACNHAGYVAANLAVRWHPNGQSVYFLDRTQAGRMSLFEFDLQTKNRRLVFAADAEAMVFDWSPRGRFLAAVVFRGNSPDSAAQNASAESSGVWVWSIAADQWWRLPGSDGGDAIASGPSILESLRSSLPAWDPSEKRLASVIRAEIGGEQLEQRVLLAELDSRQVAVPHRGEAAISDLHWRPDGQQLGLLEGESPGNLRFLDLDGLGRAPLQGEEVRRFVGWNADGQRWAYLTPESQGNDADRWVLLFSRIPKARDRVWVSRADGSESNRVVLDEMRVTFPRWSPQRDELSLWCTYAPTHRSWLSMFLPWTLRPGDPAATLDAQTGELRWMAVNAHEETQVGHYYLLKRDYETAWTWYERAAKHREPTEPIKLSQLDRFLGAVSVHQNPFFFEYYCLTKLQRTEEAAERLRQFRESMSLDAEDALQVLGLSEASQAVGQADGQAVADASKKEAGDPARAALQREWRDMAGLADALLQSAFATEVFFSLDARADGLEFFRTELENAANDPTRLAAALSLSQLLLADGKRGQYTELVTETLLPLLMQFHCQQDLQLSDLSDLSRLPRFVKQAATLAPGAAACLPLWSAEFLDGYSADELAALAERLEELSNNAVHEDQRLVADVLSLGVLAKLADSERWQAVKQRLESNPWLVAHTPVKLESPEQFLADAEALIQQFRESTTSQ